MSQLSFAQDVYTKRINSAAEDKESKEKIIWVIIRKVSRGIDRIIGRP